MPKQDYIEPEKHESYGVLQISRVSTTPPTDLFGSSIRHGNTIILKICEGKKSRDFQTDRYYEGKMLIQVEMSSTQFANAITSLNVGGGTPVTLRYVLGDKWDEKFRRYRKPCPEINARKLVNKELKNEMAHLGEKVEQLSKDTKRILQRKGTTIKSAEKKKLLDDLNSLITEIKSNIPFAHDCFNRSVNKTVTEAKGEIDVTLQAMREKLGDKVLQGAIEVPMLEERKNEEK